MVYFVYLNAGGSCYMKAKISTEQYLSLQAEYENLKNQNAELSAKLEEAYQNIDNIMSQLDWLKKQVFGQKSEKTQYLPFEAQLPLSGEICLHRR